GLGVSSLDTLEAGLLLRLQTHFLELFGRIACRRGVFASPDRRRRRLLMGGGGGGGGGSYGLRILQERYGFLLSRPLRGLDRGLTARVARVRIRSRGRQQRNDRDRDGPGAV